MCLRLSNDRSCLSRLSFCVSVNPFTQIHSYQGLAFDSGGGAVKDKNGLDPEREQLTDTAIKAKNVGILDGVVSISHALNELVDPDAGINC